MIKARIKAENPDANLKAYAESYRSFSWTQVEQEFTWHKGGKINIVHEAIDRWAEKPDKQSQKALIFEKGGKIQTFTYLELKEISCRWANLLVKQGFRTGDRLFIFLPPCPEIYFSMLACARLGVLFCPLYHTLGYDELEDRLVNSTPRGILTHPDLAERIQVETLPGVENVFLTEGPLTGTFPGEVLVADIDDSLSSQLSTKWLAGDTPLYLLYTSGSTGPPKGVVHSHQDMVGHLMTARYVLDLREDSVLWTDGDPAWVTGTVYSTFAPWLAGATSVVHGDPFSASTWYRTLEMHNVSNWYTTPRTIRRLLEAGDDLPHRYDFSALRHVCAVGEALGPELFYWVRKNLNLSPHDTWWMTETGMICLANYPCLDIKPGSMGKPVPGVEAAIIDDHGERLPILTLGQLALKPGWPAMMREIWKDEHRYEEYFRLDGWFLTGDMAIEDEEGYFYHQGRMDDLIKVAGEKLIGPYEIEQILCRHPAVHEAAVISKEGEPGKPTLKAFITIDKAYSASARLNHEIKAFVRGNLSSLVELAEIQFIDSLPKTRSGKLLRRVLRAGELGLPIGDHLGLED
jgi:acetyl-CoA synthetase